MLQAWVEIWHFPAYKGWMSYQTALSQDLFISPFILNLASRQEDLSGGTCVTGNSFLLQFLRERAPSWGVSHRFFTCVWNLSVCLLKFPLLSLWAPVENDKSCDGFCFCWGFLFFFFFFLRSIFSLKYQGYSDVYTFLISQQYAKYTWHLKKTEAVWQLYQIKS